MSLPSNHWDSHVDSVKAIKSQLPEIRDSLLLVDESDKEPSTSNEAQSLAERNFVALNFECQ